VLLSGDPVSASLFDFGIFIANNAAELLERGSGPYLYLPKLENSEEAALWRSAFELTPKAARVARKTPQIYLSLWRSPTTSSTS